MNLYILNLLEKWVSFALVSVLSIFGSGVETNQLALANDHDKNTNIITNVIQFNTIKNYDAKIPTGDKKIIVEGKNGISFTNESDEKIILETPVDEEVIIGTGRFGKHKGVMTGYGPDCSTCSGIGNVACKTKDRKKFNLINDDVYYQDDEYGRARVLAADLSYFPCGTIVEVVSSNLGTFTGIVMDTGYTMREKFKQGIFHFDVAFKTEKDENISKATNMSGNVEFNVKRWGW